MGYHVGGILCMPAAANIAGSRLLRWGEAWIHGPRLAIVEQKVDSQALIEWHV